MPPILFGLKKQGLEREWTKPCSDDIKAMMWCLNHYMGWNTVVVIKKIHLNARYKSMPLHQVFSENRIANTKSESLSLIVSWLMVYEKNYTLHNMSSPFITCTGLFLVWHLMHKHVNVQSDQRVHLFKHVSWEQHSLQSWTSDSLFAFTSKRKGQLHPQASTSEIQMTFTCKNTAWIVKTDFCFSVLGPQNKKHS